MIQSRGAKKEKARRLISLISNKQLQRTKEDVFGLIG